VIEQFNKRNKMDVHIIQSMHCELFTFTLIITIRHISKTDGFFDHESNKSSIICFNKIIYFIKPFKFILR